jgi:hypothetical protein
MTLAGWGAPHPGLDRNLLFEKICSFPWIQGCALQIRAHEIAALAFVIEHKMDINV